MQNNRLRKRMIIMLMILAIVFGLIFGYKLLGAIMFKRFLATQQNPIMTVSAMHAHYDEWTSTIQVSGSLRAVEGVDVTSELAGMVRSIDFTPGAFVSQGQKLAQLNIDADVAQLRSLEANAELARITYRRDIAQLRIHAVSQATVDTDLANVKSYEAQIAEQRANIEKKRIVAPFAGRLGVKLINIGQYLNPGDKVVSLQSLDPIYADFYVPQQALAKLKVGLVVTIKTDTFPNKTFSGKITTIDPAVNVDNRNVLVEATLSNPKFLLSPGMFVTVEVIENAHQKYLTLPQAAVSFNPYGDIVYVLTPEDKKTGQSTYIAKQAFVTTGEIRGDQIAILKGIKENDLIVTSGQLKLKNGSRVKINNTVQPSNKPAPEVADDEL